jgi:uncharacterized protein with ParB-like and HNH nuclease domain
MKFKDIKRFTAVGSYQVNIPFDYFKSIIDKYINEYGLQMIPDFQRGHVWNKEQQIKYVEFFFRGGSTGKTIYFNDPNWMVNRTKDYTDFVLVDGLQRLTAMLKFVNNELPIFDGNYYKDFEDKFHITDNSLLFNVNNLQTKKEVLIWYLELNTGGVVHTEEELNRVRKLLKLEQENKL